MASIGPNGVSGKRQCSLGPTGKLLDRLHRETLGGLAARGDGFALRDRLLPLGFIPTRFGFGTGASLLVERLGFGFASLAFCVGGFERNITLLLSDLGTLHRLLAKNQ